MTTTLITTAGPINVITAKITELQEGAWTARIEIDSDEDIVGPVTLVEGLTKWVGSQKRGAQEHGRTIAQLVGGTGGLSGDVGVRNYNSPFIADILGDLMLDTGEVLSPDVDAALLIAQVERWSRRSGAGGLSLKQITDETTAEHWRIRRDGLVWLGVEDYPVVPPTFQFIEISRDPANDTITIAPEEDQILVAVGDNFLDRNVAGVVTHIEPGQIRQVISWESGDSSKDRLLGPLQDIVRATVERHIDYTRFYPSVVVLQNANGTLDLLPDDVRVRGDGFKEIIIDYGLPGVSAIVPPGGRVNLFFQNGDPKQPRAGLFEGSGVTTITIDGGTDFVALAAKVDAFIASVDKVIRTDWIVVASDGGAALKAAYVAELSTAPASVKSSTLKTT